MIITYYNVSYIPEFLSIGLSPELRGSNPPARWMNFFGGWITREVGTEVFRPNNLGLKLTKKNKLYSLKLTSNRTWKWMVGILLLFPFGARPMFSGHVSFREGTSYLLFFASQIPQQKHLQIGPETILSLLPGVSAALSVSDPVTSWIFKSRRGTGWWKPASNIAHLQWNMAIFTTDCFEYMISQFIYLRF